MPVSLRSKKVGAGTVSVKKGRCRSKKVGSGLGRSGPVWCRSVLIGADRCRWVRKSASGAGKVPVPMPVGFSGPNLMPVRYVQGRYRAGDAMSISKSAVWCRSVQVLARDRGNCCNANILEFATWCLSISY